MCRQSSVLTSRILYSQHITNLSLWLFLLLCLHTFLSRCLCLKLHRTFSALPSAPVDQPVTARVTPPGDVSAAIPRCDLQEARIPINSNRNSFPARGGDRRGPRKGKEHQRSIKKTRNFGSFHQQRRCLCLRTTSNADSCRAGVCCSSRNNKLIFNY